jgi:hypothetical protein
MSLLRSPGKEASWLSFGIFLLLLSGILSCSAYLSGPSWADEPLPPNSVRVNNTNALFTWGGVQVPISIRHSDDVDTLQIGLDYDELMMRFEECTFEDCIGIPAFDPYVDHEDGYLLLKIPFDRTKEVDQEAYLVQLKFSFREIPDYGYRSDSAIRVDTNATRFNRAQDSMLVRPTLMLDGNVAIYFRNAIEVGSANVSLDPQIITLPIYVTHIEEETNPFTIGLDYDELFLQLTDVIPRSPWITAMSVYWEAREVTFSALKGFPKLLRHHLCDLEFAIFYDPTQTPKGKVIKVVPTPVSDALMDTGAGGAVEIRGGALTIVEYFLRGDSDGSGVMDIGDAVKTLTYLTGTNQSKGNEAAKSIPCLDAADSDGNGVIDLTDAVRTLGFLFLGTEEPPVMPFPVAGPNPAMGHTLGCEKGIVTFDPVPLGDSF